MHTIQLTYRGESPDLNRDPMEYSVSIDGDGGIGHFKEAFRAFMVASGYAFQTVQEVLPEE